MMALERINSLLLVSADETLIQTAWKWVEDLDTIPTLDRDNIYIYNVRNSIASELAELVNSLIAEEEPQSKTAKKTTRKTQSDTSTSRARPAAINQIRENWDPHDSSNGSIYSRI